MGFRASRLARMLPAALTFTLINCGGRGTSSNSSNDEKPAADGTNAQGGDNANASPITTDPQSPLAKGGATCSTYLSMWRFHLSKLAPGLTQGASACQQCLELKKWDCGSEATAVCSSALQCVSSHCLCPMAPPISSALCAEEPPDDLCGCIADCLPDPPAPCDQNWINYLACMNRTCSDVCR